jgi:hypothetical protein
VESLDERSVPSATHFAVKAPPSAFAGTQVPVFVAALDDANHLAPDYTGTVHFTSSDSGATLPGEFTFTAGDHGFHLFSATFQATGADTVTATDTATSSITGTATVNVVATPAATHFVVFSKGSTIAGSPTPVFVVALDANNFPVLNYTGTVHFTSSDSAAALPADYTFVAGDHGFHRFQATLNTTGAQTVTATDTATSSITGTAHIQVNPAPVATHFAVFSKPHATAGAPTGVSVVALDAANHPVLNYTGTVHFTSSDGSAALPADYTFVAGDHGFHSFQVTLNTVGAQTVTATDTATSSITGTANITVDPAPVATHFGLIPASPFVRAGHAFTLYVVALDANNHIVSNYTGTVHFSSTDNAAVLPSDFTFAAADHGYHAFTVTLNTVGPQTISVLDSVGMLNGSVNLFVVHA